METRLLHNPRPVKLRIFSNTKSILLRLRNGSHKQLYSRKLLGPYYLMFTTWWLKMLETGHGCSGLSAGIMRCCSIYTIGVSIAQQSISQNISANMRSCKFWILFNALLSDLQYWLYPKISIVETEHQYHSRMVAIWGTSNCSPGLPVGFDLSDWASDAA